ncbi:MAG TPA: rhodanese-like domain-containing protein [Syntrophales bacterium]|nr:rhodanese-like domain-containing protein [Syntrophales bacterium]
MNRRIFLRALPLVFLLLAFTAPAEARDIPPIVSTEWLQANLDNPRLIILDVRKVEDYKAGHIPKAVSSFFRAWAYKKGELYSEVPELDDLQEMISEVGIGTDSLVVVTGSVASPVESYQSARVACTLQYAGISNVALLNGGIDAWIREKRKLTTVPGKPVPKPFTAKLRHDFIADKEYVKTHMGQVLLLDVREPEIFSGRKKLDCIPRAGHIPGAINMPTSCAFNADGTFKTREELAAIAEAAIGKDLSRKVVTYCDVGQCCPTWAFLLRELLGYRNIRLYDGSTQEWMADPAAPVEK